MFHRLILPLTVYDSVAPVNKLVSLTWLLWALRSFRRFTLYYISYVFVVSLQQNKRTPHVSSKGYSDVVNLFYKVQRCGCTIFVSWRLQNSLLLNIVCMA